MSEIPDAPYIREACLRGTEYMYSYIFGHSSTADDIFDEHEDQEEKI